MGSFKIRILARMMLLAATIILFAFLIREKDFLILNILLGLLAVLQIYSLVHFVDRTNRDLSRFLLSIKYDDTSQAFSSAGLGTSFTELKDAFGQVMQKLQESRSGMEARSRYLNTLIQHVGVGLLCFKPDGTVDLVNSAAKKLLKTATLSNVRNLKEDSPGLVDALLGLKHGDRRLVKIEKDGETGYLSLFAHTFILRDERYILVSIQNIQRELEEKEMEAQQNLIRVLTHEIMNSLTPITSMTATLLEMIDSNERSRDGAPGGFSHEEMGEIAGALETIHQRSRGLVNFVTSYRNMALIPKPKFKLLAISDLFNRVETLMKSRLADGGIGFHWAVEPKTLELTADPDLMEQVLINLILNAIYAVSGREQPFIRLSASLSPESKVVVAVEDNGTGIVEEALGKIFIPFFTTRKQGSGIGLSLSRQILRLHNATIRVKSRPDVGTTCILRFN